jgi:isopentenyl-diphosphate Delta-isomerase
LILKYLEMNEFVVLVDENDIDQGLMEKMEAHVKGVLHRAFSVFIFNNNSEMLLQQRAFSKYHSPGLWTNTCCSHPRNKEKAIDAAHRRLIEEMGFDCEIIPAFTFKYKAPVGQGLIEHEFDHVFTGTYNSIPSPNPDEVAAWKWVAMTELEEDMLLNPEKYTVWFRIAFPELKSFLNRK